MFEATLVSINQILKNWTVLNMPLHYVVGLNLISLRQKQVFSDVFLR
jgi:hypothetical protein